MWRQCRGVDLGQDRVERVNLIEEQEHQLRGVVLAESRLATSGRIVHVDDPPTHEDHDGQVHAVDHLR